VAEGKTGRGPEKIMSFYITTPIYYVNAQPHLGHAYSTIVADTICRFKKLCGEEVFFQTGTDEHGDKIAAAANRAAVSPKEYVDRISAMFQAAWPQLNIWPDNFIRTTDPHHVATVQTILQQVYDRGDIYFDRYTGLYCVGCERFLTAKELVNGNCPDHLTPPNQVNEENYFFRMSNYQEWLIDHINSHPDFIAPERYRNEVLAFLQDPLEDLCISRPTSRLTWGIPLPFDDRFVTYVWFDALINYLTGIGYPDGDRFAGLWAGAEHIIAKDILKPHAIYWPTMLKAMGLAPYRRLHVHGYWNVNETKMSKSIGNVVRPDELVDEFGVDPVRYFILREMSFGLDASFSTAALLDRQNSDLANDLGNLFSRSLTMINKFAGGRIPAAGVPGQADSELAAAAVGMVAEFCRQMNDFAFNRALQAVWKTISQANKYIVTNAPWELAKDQARSTRLHTVLYHLAETLRLIALVLQPIMPETSAKMRQGLGFEDELIDMSRDGRWGLSRPGSEVFLGPSLFPRLERKKQKTASPAPPSREQEELLSFDDFKKFDLRVAEIVEAERINKSKRLLKLTVKAPEKRIVVAGIAEHYNPKEIIGKQVIIVANLKPAKLMGVTSQGMVLAAKTAGDEGERLVLSCLSAPVAPGSKVS
jgi:methionyl-tRNA synthetase